jgi:O-antigen ligase
MPTFSLASIKKIYFKNQLKFLELTILSLFLAFLPSLEAPKNIFLGSYLIVALYRQSQLPSSKWGIWDWVFLSLIASSLLSALFPFIATGSEWKGFRGMLLWVIFGWTLYRSEYNEKEKKYLFIFSIAMTFPPLIWGLVEFLVLHTKNELQLHSVGNVNHSAIYLCMIFGAFLIILIDQYRVSKKASFFIGSLFLIFLFWGLATTESRGAIGIALVLLFTIIFLSLLTVKTKTILSALILLILILNITFTKSPLLILEHLKSRTHSFFTVGERVQVWRGALEISRLNPLLGIGNGNWNFIKLDEIKFAAQSRGESFDADNYAIQHHHPHNIYLANLVDRGIFGLIIFLNFMLIWSITLINSYKKFNQDSKAMLFIMGSFSAWASIFGIGFVNTTFHHENALLALFFLSLHLNYLRQKNQLKLFN